MKPLSRIAALAVLLLPAWLTTPAERAQVSQDYPLRRPVTPDALRQRGSLRLSISAESLQRSRAPLRPADFDYDLLSRFASNLGVELVVLEAASDADAAQALRSGRADVAVLPADFGGAAGALAAHACPHAAGGAPARLDAFAWSDSPDLARLLDGAVRRAADVELDDQVYRSYCVRPAPSAPGLPFARSISRYKGVIAKHSEAAGLDWRLVAALISEESSFEEKAVSGAGAKGLMQLMPRTPAEVGIASIASPEANIRAGVRYLSRLFEQFSEARPEDRLALALASYLLGPGHVLDAQELARELGLNPQGWQRGLEETLPLLEDERFFRETRLGFARGRHAVGYVNRILGRYEIYRSQLARHPAAPVDRDV
ncbi:MAG: transglycosylase SLT domain-containing protein [Deltaproteobacteria bacterium]|nr:transglycosylase SLT domain-containing protein [Deltaproteobacteria bacterium]